MVADARPTLPRIARLVALLAGLALLASTGCVSVQCQLNSDCPERSSCVANQCISHCGNDRDCLPPTPFCSVNGVCVATMADAGIDVRMESGTDAADSPPPIDHQVPPVDNYVPPVDNYVPPVDNYVPPVDNYVPPILRAYLDACGSDADCTSGMCATDAPRFCTRSCSVHSDCGNGQVCAAGRCALDDTGMTGCNPATAAPCHLYCYGAATSAHCTRDCSSPADCPSGYACSPVSGRHVCVKIEIPCAGPTQCPSGLGFCGAGMVGCTANCTTAADCPLRLPIPGFGAYTCEVRSGQSVCIPPADVLGSDPIGAVCAATGTVYCRSGACDDATVPSTCNQNCTPNGGCGPGYGCYPEPTGADIYFVCHAAGRAWVNEACARSADCYTGLCDTSGYCSRLCNDGLCPTGMHCLDTGLASVDGTRVMLCRR